MEFKEFITFNKNQVSDRLYKYPSLLNSLCEERDKYLNEFEIEKLELDYIISQQRILKRSKEKALSNSNKSTNTEINDKVNIIKEIKAKRRLLIDISNDINRVKAEIEIMKDTRKNLEILSNDNREDRKSSSMSNRKGGHNE